MRIVSAPVLRHAARRVLVFATLATAAACGAPQYAPPEVALIYLTSTPAEALVLVDDVPVGYVSELQEQVTVPSGSHRLEVRADGYIPYRADVDFEQGETYGLIVELWPVVDELD